MRNKFVFGITGPTGAGKTTASDEFRSLGVQVLDCDRIGHEVINDTSCKQELTDAFGEGILDDNGMVNRKRLGKIVFSDKAELNKLNSITHKYIKKNVIEGIEKADGDIVGVDGAVLIGSGIDKLLDSMVSVIADDDIRLCRIMKRDGISEEDAQKRINSQKNNEFYLENSDYIIYNNDKSIKKRVEELKAIFMNTIIN